MTTERDFDRIARAWLEQGPNEAPDRAIAAALLAIDSTPQVRRSLRWPTWRPQTMTRLPVLVALGGALLLLVGGLLLGGGTPPGPAPAPASPTPSATSAAYAEPRPLPPDLVGGWVAPARGVPGLEEGPNAMIFFGALDGRDAPDFGVDRPGFLPIQPSDVVETAPGVIRLTSTSTSGLCTFEDVGSYRWSIDATEPWLTLEAIDDECDARAQILPGQWMRSLAHDSRGGPGIATNFLPYITFTLPREAWSGGGLAESETLVLDNDTQTADLRFWKDPDGFMDPCDREAARLDLDPGVDAFVAYLRAGPQFTVVDETELTVNGHRAVEVEIRLGDDISQPCAPLDGNAADRSGILLWASHAAGGNFWNGRFGDQWSLVVTEVDGATILMEIVRQDGSSWPVDRSVLDSIRFVDALPTPPAG